MAVCNLACEGLSGTSSSSSSAPDLALRKLYIGSLSPEVTTEMLLNYFSRHAEIEEGSVAYDKDCRDCRKDLKGLQSLRKDNECICGEI